METATTIIKATSETFPAEYDKLKAASKAFICVFKGGIDPATGQSWCPDCVAAEGSIKKVVHEKLNGEMKIPVIEVDVGLRDR